MNVKILLTPLIIIVAITLAIWFVYPAYSNGVDGAKEKLEKLRNEESKFEGIQNKNKRVEKLFAELSSLGSDKDVLYQFIPEKNREEEIIDNLNYLASTSGVSISKFVITQSAANANIVKPVNLNDDSGGFTMSSPLPQNIKVSVSLAGSYENIRNFLDKIDKFERYADFSGLQISKNLANNAERESASLDILSVTASIDFNFLEKVKLSEFNADDPIFSENSPLNLSAITDIKNKKTMDVLKLDVGQKGKTNPFMP